MGSAFHCQQAAEKALKAALIAAGLPAPRIHRLVELHAAIPEPGLAHIDPDDLEELQPWAVVGRYPGDVPEISADELATLLSTATNVVSLVEKLTSRLRSRRTGRGADSGGTS